MITRYDDVTELFAALNAHPGRPALTFYQGRTPAGQLTYGELLTRVAAMAARLHGNFGIGPGDRIALLSVNRLEVPVVCLAAMRLGAALVPLNPGAPPEDWSYVVDHAEAKLVVIDVVFRDRLPDWKAKVVAFDEIGEILDCDAAGDAPPTGEALAVVLYTSGTTGRPKGVALSQRAVLANAWSMATNFGLEQTCQMTVLPLYHAHALGFGLMTALGTGGHLIVAERFDPFAWAEIIRRESVEVTSVVPSLLPALLDMRVTADKVPSLRHILVSSAPLSAALARSFESRTGIRLVQGWGLSEYTNFACCLSPAMDRELLYDDDSTCVGPPLPGTEVKLSPTGELCVRGHSRMLGYYRDPEATRQAIDDDGWLHTGDEGRAVERNGRPFFFITGRIKEIIIRGGEKLSPLAIERRIFEAVPELEGHLVVLGFLHRAQGEEVGAYVEAAAIANGERQRLSTAIEGLPPEIRPKVLIVGEAPIPRTHTGKIQRRKLQPLFDRFEEARGPLRIETAP